MNIEEEIKEEIKVINSKIDALQTSCLYITSMLEDLTSTVRPKDDNAEMVQDTLKTLKNKVMTDKGIGQRPDVKAMMTSLFDTIIPGGN